ncbi:MAG TPA: HDIG domain-containing protein, partial [Polyangiaceae bacterium]|nr:HDIG domain-containing protein [Polyangiaceae bacterium]
MTTPSQAPLSAPDRERAIHALERAVACAERGVADRPVVLIESVDMSGLSPVDVRALLDRVMLGEYADEGLDSLLATGVLDALLPEIKALVGFGDGEWRHKDVWKHTKQVVTQSVPRVEVRYGALFHDIGKVKTRSIDPNGKVHFLGHAEVGTRMFDKLERRLGMFSP